MGSPTSSRRRILAIAERSSRETCGWEIPSVEATSAWVQSQKKRRSTIWRSRGLSAREARLTSARASMTSSSGGPSGAASALHQLERPACGDCARIGTARAAGLGGFPSLRFLGLDAPRQPDERGPIAEMAAHLALHAAREIGAQRDRTGRVAAVDRAHECQRTDLLEVLARLAELGEAAGDVVHEREVRLDQQTPGLAGRSSVHRRHGTIVNVAREFSPMIFRIDSGFMG